MQRNDQGFTLVEAMIIIIVLGVLATVVVPQFSKANTDVKLSAMTTNLQAVRSQIQRYQTEHEGRLPSIANFAEEMTMATDWAGNTAPPGTAGYDYGPYFRSIPKNPYTGGATIGQGETGTSDWYYNHKTGQFRANHHAEFTAY
jgi:type II secretory pathway pseudopilin PulG